MTRTAKTDEPVETYTVTELIEAAPKVFEVSKAVATGALYGVTERLTKDEAAAKIKKFKSKPVQPGDGKEVN